MSNVLSKICLFILVTSWGHQGLGYERLLWSVPFANSTQSLASRLDYNLRGYGSLGVELGFFDVAGFMKLGASSDVQEKSGSDIGVYYSLYSRPAQMAGLYTAIGFGYRQQKLRTSEEEAEFTDDLYAGEHSFGRFTQLRAGYRLPLFRQSICLGLGIHYDIYYKNVDKPSELALRNNLAPSDLNESRLLAAIELSFFL